MTKQESFRKLMESSATMLENTANEIKTIKERHPERSTVRDEEITQLMNEVKGEYEKAGGEIQDIIIGDKPFSQNNEEDVLKRPVSETNIPTEETKIPTPKINTQKVVTPPTSPRLNRKYDTIPLPSKGECYPHKKSRLSIYYLTAREENLIMSINLYSEGMLIESILKSVIADKDINVDELVQGDIDAILLFLRATAYGPEYPIVVKNPFSNIEFSTTINLASIKYNELKLKGDENGWFEYKTDEGDVLKFGFPDFGEDKMFKKMIMDSSKSVAVKRLETMIRDLNDIKENEILSITDKEIIERNIAVQSISKIHNVIKKGVGDNILDNILLANMTRIIKSFNGETNRQLVYESIANMRAGTARKFRKYFDEHIFGLNTVIDVVIPEGQERSGETIKVNVGVDETFLMTVTD
jgi:hypothetical protein